MKKLVLLLLSIAILTCFVACNNQKPQDPTPEHTHSFGEWSVSKNATCTEDGERVRYCDCGEKQSDTIASIGHNYIDGECTNCGDIITAPKCEHTNVEVIPAKASTCTETGLTEGKKCSSCGEVVVAQKEAPLKAHNEVIDTAIDATCTKTGLTEGSHCSVCGTTLVAQQETPKIAHVYDDKYDATCNKCGFVRATACNHSDTETIKGYAASCTATGLTNGTKCKKCGETLTEQTIIPMIAHTEVTDAAIAATCTSTGLTAGKHCSVCSTVIVAQTVVSANGHTKVTDPAVEATCTSTGLTEGSHCSVCNVVLVSQAVIYSSHQYSNAYVKDDNYHWIECVKCDNAKDKELHTFDNGICIVCDESVQTTDGIIYDISADGTYYEVIGYEGTDNKVRIAGEYQGLPVRHIYKKAFYRKNITEVVIPDSVTSIGTEAFRECRNLITVVFSKNLQSLSDHMFYECDSLKSIVIPDGVTEIGWCTFAYCDNLTFVDIPNSVTYIASHAFYKCSSLTSVVIPDGVTSIQESVFANCIKLTSVTIPNSVTRINAYAFENCKSLAYVDIPNTVTELSYSVFNGTALTFNEYENCKYLAIANNPYFALIGTTNSKLSSYDIHPDTKLIAGQAFYECSRLAHIILPNGLKGIGYQAFELCSSLVDIIIPDSVITMGDKAFSSCKSLTNVVIGNSLTRISDSAFIYCSSLVSINIPNSVTRIGTCAFYGCESLVSVVFENTSGWYRYHYLNETSITNILDQSLANQRSAASLLRNYEYYIFKRNE